MMMLYLQSNTPLIDYRKVKVSHGWEMNIQIVEGCVTFRPICGVNVKLTPMYPTLWILFLLEWWHINFLTSTSQAQLKYFCIGLSVLLFVSK